MPKILEGSAREVILNIKKFCEEEKKAKALLIPLRNVRSRVAALAGISEKTVTRIVKEGKVAAETSTKLVTPGRKRPRAKKFVLSSADQTFVRQKIHNYYAAHKEMPSINKLRLELAEEIFFKGSNSTLRRILKAIGYKFKSPMPKMGLIDKPVKKRALVKKEKLVDTKLTPQQMQQPHPQLQPLPPPLEPSYPLYMRDMPMSAMVMPEIPQNIPQMHNLTNVTSIQHNSTMLTNLQHQHQHHVREMQML